MVWAASPMRSSIVRPRASTNRSTPAPGGLGAEWEEGTAGVGDAEVGHAAVMGSAVMGSAVMGDVPEVGAKPAVSKLRRAMAAARSSRSHVTRRPPGGSACASQMEA
jgi:hypothetical protein